MVSCGGKNKVSIQGSDGDPILFLMQVSFFRNLLPLFLFHFDSTCLAK